LKVILADDHPLFRNGFSLLFKELIADSEVLEAATLEEAMALAECHSDAALLLLDLSMPGMPGVAGVRRVIEVCPQLPVAVLSACERRDTVLSVIAAGALGFIPKSSSPEVLQLAIRLILSGSVYIPAGLMMTSEPVDDDLHMCSLKLSDRQRCVLRLLAAGMSNKEICRELQLSEGTIKVHVAAVFRALNANNRTEAANKARRLGLID
jgi:DNA-binding NarL/FixJ family response regulator